MAMQFAHEAFDALYTDHLTAHTPPTVQRSRSGFRRNSVSHHNTLKRVTGESFNSKELADSCNQTIAQA